MSHLLIYNHSQYSVLQSTTKINELVDKAVEMGMPVALTDYSNLYGAYHFVDVIHKHVVNKEVIEHNNQVKNGVLDAELKHLPFKGVVGCELSICKDHQDHSVKDNGKGVVFFSKKQRRLSQFGQNEFYRLCRWILLCS